MPDREKVMREITLCTGGGPCEGCSHYDNHEDDLVGCMDELLSDALELLNAMEEKTKALEQTIEDICCGGGA